jgi:uncharacterized RDD family membrane protein YckC
MFCPNCGRSVSDDARFCASCGAPLAPPAAVTPPAGGGVATAVAPAAPPIPVAPPMPVAAAPAAVRYGGFWRRLWAFVIDSILLWFVGLPVRTALGLTGFAIGSSPWSNPDEMATRMAGMLGTVFLAWAFNLTLSLGYYSLMESSKLQASVGKIALGLKVTDLQGARISVFRAAGRHLAGILSTLILFIGYIMIAFTEKKQGLHDMIAGTLVLRKAA